MTSVTAGRFKKYQLHSKLKLLKNWTVYG